ncbi:hypothetical protein PTMSG1_07619 [Pyrenophora teres f. maculata]|nr:hypothetical protein PTMSG1_07619 [Pyrenophora teres f. maculata]
MARDKRPARTNPFVPAESHGRNIVQHQLNRVEQTVKQTKEPRRPDFENTLHIITSRLDRWPVIPDELEWTIQLTQKEEELAIVQMIGIVKGDIQNAKWKARERKSAEQRQQEGVGMAQPSRQKGTEKQTGLKHDEELEPQQAKSFEGKGKKRARERQARRGSSCSISRFPEVEEPEPESESDSESEPDPGSKPDAKLEEPEMDTGVAEQHHAPSFGLSLRRTPKRSYM